LLKINKTKINGLRDSEKHMPFSLISSFYLLHLIKAFIRIMINEWVYSSYKRVDEKVRMGHYQVLLFSPRLIIRNVCRSAYCHIKRHQQLSCHIYELPIFLFDTLRTWHSIIFTWHASLISSLFIIHAHTWRWSITLSNSIFYD